MNNILIYLKNKCIDVTTNIVPKIQTYLPENKLVIGTFIFFLITLLLEIRNYLKPNTRSKMIREARTLALEQNVKIDSFTLLIGSLMEKVNSFQSRIDSMDECIQEELQVELDNINTNIKKLRNSIGSLEDNIDNINQQLSTERTRNDSNMDRIQHKLNLICNKLGHFSVEEYDQFCYDMSNEIKTIRDAIFIPEDEDESSYDL